MTSSGQAWTRRRLQSPRKFKVRARDLGFRPGLNYDNIGKLLEKIDEARRS